MPTLSYSPWFKKTTAFQSLLKVLLHPMSRKTWKTTVMHKKQMAQKWIKKSTSTEKNVAIATPQVPQNRKNKTKDIAVNKKCIVKRDYEESFMRESGMTARKGKQVCIRSNFHDRIMKLIQVIGKNEVTIASYIDNVLASHFEDYQEDIAESFGKHIKTFTNI